MQANRGHVCLLAIILLPLAAAGAAETRREKEAAAKASTEQVLRDEAKQPVDRRARLDELIARSPEAAALRWHAGYVWDGELWRPFETVPASTGDLETVELYRTLRDAAKLTPERHLELADWCRKHKLPDQERAHLTALLDTASAAEQAPLLTRMGYQQVFGQWLSQRQLADWSRHLARSQASLQKWGPKLDKFSEQLAGSATARDRVARAAGD